MRILFCNIAWMKYYKGDAKGNDHPQGGGSFVAENQYAHEEFNFHPINLSKEGFGDTASLWLLKNALNKHKKILWIAHRQMLLDQAAESFKKNSISG